MNNKIFGILIVCLFIGAGFVPIISSRDIDNNRYMILEYQKNDLTTKIYFIFVFYLGKITNFSNYQFRGIDYYQWKPVYMIIFYISHLFSSEYDIGVKIVREDIYCIPVVAFHGKINSDFIFGYFWAIS